MPSADHRPVCNALQFNPPALVIAHQSLDVSKSNQGIAVGSDKRLPKLLFQVLERIGEQQFAVLTVGRHVLLPGDKTADRFDRHGLQATVGLAADLPARPGVTAQSGQLHAINPGSPGQCPGQCGLAYRFEQVGHRVMLQGLQRVLVVGRAKDHRWWVGQRLQSGGHFDTVHSRHPYIQ